MVLGAVPGDGLRGVRPPSFMGLPDRARVCESRFVRSAAWRACARTLVTALERVSVSPCRGLAAWGRVVGAD